MSERMTFLKEGLDKFAAHGGDQLNYLQDHKIPESLEALAQVDL